jgi:hypothetical protein
VPPPREVTGPAIVGVIAKLCACAVIVMPHGAHPAGYPAVGYAIWQQGDAAPSEVWLDSTIVASAGLGGWWPLFVISHELGHVALNTLDEDAANCYAWKNLGRVGISLGLTPAQVRAAWRQVPRRWPAYASCLERTTTAASPVRDG